MRGLCRPILVLVLASLPVLVRADDSDLARATIEEAARAQGGMDRLARTASMTRVGKCDVYPPGDGKPVTTAGEITFHLPEQARWSHILEIKGTKNPLHHAISGDKGWRSSEGGAPQALSKPELEEFRQRAYVAWVCTLAPLGQDNGFAFAALPPTNVGGTPTVGVKVSRKERPEIKLYFDKTTHLLIKAEWKGKYQTLDADFELLFSNYKEFEGIKLPTKQVEYLEGRKLAEWTFAECKFVDKFDEATFTHP